MHESRGYWRASCKNDIVISEISMTWDGKNVTHTATVIRKPKWFYFWVKTTKEELVRFSDGSWYKPLESVPLRYKCHLYNQLESRLNSEKYYTKLLEAANNL